MSPISERASEALTTTSETEQYDDESVGDGVSIESKPLPSIPVESPRGTSTITLRSVSPLMESPVLDGEVVRTRDMPAVFQQGEDAKGSPLFSDSTSTVKLPRVMRAPPLARDGTESLVEEPTGTLEEMRPNPLLEMRTRTLEEMHARLLEEMRTRPLEETRTRPLRHVTAHPLGHSSTPPSVDLSQLVSDIHDLSERCADGILELIKVLSFL
jgi:hypothetical protein